jgi:hypothetical protein
MMPIKPMLDSLGSIKKGQKILKGMNQTKSKDISSLKLKQLDHLRYNTNTL